MPIAMRECVARTSLIVPSVSLVTFAAVQLLLAPFFLDAFLINRGIPSMLFPSLRIRIPIHKGILARLLPI
jgi:hypothetical protein